MALYPAAIQKPIPPGINDPKIKPRVVILHVAVFIGKSLYDYFKDRSGGVESHFYIRLDGTVEQYRDTSIQADANTDANDFAISIETEGMEYGVWTPEQLAAIKALILWCHKTHDIPLVRCPAWDGSGIGYHTLFPGRWDKRGASCPGPDRKLQFNQIITPWLATAESEDDMAMTPEERQAFIEDVADEMLKRPVKDADGTVRTVGYAIGRTLRESTLASRLAVEQAKKGRPLTVDEIDDIAKATVDALDDDYTATVTLTPKETP